jgi:serine/threonine protein kinase
MVMEYAEGGDMEELIKSRNGKPFPEEMVVDWLIQMCLSLKHIHDRKILHRDIKTSNIFLTKDNKIKVTSNSCSLRLGFHEFVYRLFSSATSALLAISKTHSTKRKRRSGRRFTFPRSCVATRPTDPRVICGPSA